MLLIIGLFILTVICSFVVYKTFDDYNLLSILSTISLDFLFLRLSVRSLFIRLSTLLVILIIAILLFGIWAISANVTKESDTYAMYQRYESLIYQAENNFYDNDNDYGKKELVDEIRNWNENLAAKRVLHNSIIVNWLYPIDYDEFDFIPMDIFEAKEITNAEY